MLLQRDINQLQQASSLKDLYILFVLCTKEC